MNHKNREEQLIKIPLIFLGVFLTFFSTHVIAYDEAVIKTIPKSGTHIFRTLLSELQIPVPCHHYAAFSDGVPKKTVLVIRDLKDVMVSLVFWLELIANNPEKKTANDKRWAKKFLKKSHDEKLLEIIKTGRLNYSQSNPASRTMEIIREVSKLTLHLLRSPQYATFVIRFEDIIGIEAGGTMEDCERWELLSNMFRFLGYNLSTEQIETAFTKIYGNSLTYNPVKRKVGRWQEYFKSEHMRAFLKHWGAYNIALGYDNF